QLEPLAHLGALRQRRGLPAHEGARSAVERADGGGAKQVASGRRWRSSDVRREHQRDGQPRITSTGVPVIARLRSLRASGRPVLAGLAAMLSASLPLAAQRATARTTGDTIIALVGATLIDGNGGPAVPDATIVVRGSRIAQV